MQKFPNPKLARNGFTLLELLMVITVIAVLLTLLLPVINRSREQAKAVKCLTNLHTLALAVRCYCQDNHDMFPTPAIATSPTLPGWLPTDWIYWQDGHQLKDSAIAKYVGPDLPQVMVCPSDDTTRRTYTPRYPYSYTINEFLARGWQLGIKYHSVPLRMGRVANPARTIMIVDESSDTIDDGCWSPQNYDTHGRNLLSNRHDKQREDSTNPNDGRGNVVYVDGHAAFVPRLDTDEPANYEGYPGEPH